MVSRRHRHFSERDAEALLAVIASCRAGCVQASRLAPPASDLYRRTEHLIAAIDDVAEVLTGTRKSLLVEAVRDAVEVGRHAGMSGLR